MLLVSEVYTTPPAEFKTELQEMTYKVLKELDIPFERVDTEEAITMEDCLNINRALNVKVVKTLFLCNRQQTAFYLFITEGDKPFVTKDFSKALGISRVSFAPAELLYEMLGTKVGATTVFSMLLDRENKVQVVIDKDVLKEEWYGCTDGTTTCYMRVKTERILNDFLPYTKHEPKFIEV
ncbi:MAG: prolyl-tRNA synthetase associated domain-containing protein [Clostridiales bacterium]|jgi:Ala-tRNA(Pro) deacylase|nr:prolyl-tRNA synthetase associated domain-containing protein [Clostridiales bacterium]HOA33983.1 prolyl-tRNA synthetase associated domain-containing protein [Clostridiales bacterium]HOL79839.1 prolyl-tRNA synthetase associated domain-containing protein [Clostridiales bacterium]HPP67988.1 prolyl-tRNA synthetase associated domain-containing protein [Clostridiales bacterium]HPU67704.1 prolyl-tRNA synthetase associated domain-containing protein [Clostridiales bacterium]